MRIGELAARSGLTTKTLRFYEQAGVLPQPKRRHSGYRDYDEAALGRLRFIRAGQAAGLTLAELRGIIVIREDTGPPCEHVTTLLDLHLADLDTRIRELTAMLKEVCRLRARAEILNPADCDDTLVCHVITATAS